MAANLAKTKEASDIDMVIKQLDKKALENLARRAKWPTIDVSSPAAIKKSFKEAQEMVASPKE